MVSPVYAYESDGRLLPARVAGHPALDFCNTAAGWDEPERKEYLRGYDELVLWARDAGLLGPAAGERLRSEAARRPAEAGRVLRRALELREALHDVARSPRPGAAWDAVASEAQAAAAAARLEPGGWTLPEELDLPVLAVARSAAELLTSGETGRVRACPGRRCGWLFLDRRGRRRWCDMRTCGNRAKQRRRAERLS